MPSYMMWNNLFGIKNTIWALVSNLVMNGFIIVIMKNYFTQNIHPALIEAAKIGDCKRASHLLSCCVASLTTDFSNGWAYDRTGILERLDKRTVLHNRH